MAPNINYQPIMLIVLLQNDGKATREKIQNIIVDFQGSLLLTWLIIKSMYKNDLFFY